MKLNPDCIRDVLIYLEENLTYSDDEEYVIAHKAISASRVIQELSEAKGYSTGDVKYSIEKLIEVKYISATDVITGGNERVISFKIKDILYDGHEFLATVRPETIWEATKNGASKIGAMSIHALGYIAKKVVDLIISNPTVISDIASKIQ